jgi:hypothetical protein
MAPADDAAFSSREPNSSIDESMASTTMDWLRRHSGRGGQNTSIAVGTQPWGTGSSSVSAA